MTQPYLQVERLINWHIDGPNKSACRKLLAAHLKLFQTARGSVHNHQAWKGGYYDHIHEVMNIALLLYLVFSAQRKLPFSLSDALVVLFLHDLEKPWKYETGRGGKWRIKKNLSAYDEQKVKEDLIAEYGFILTGEQRNALIYVHGEPNTGYSPNKRLMRPLAAFCHVCDVISARVWFNYPLSNNDGWQCAQRFRG